MYVSRASIPVNQDSSVSSGSTLRASSARPQAPRLHQLGDKSSGVRGRTKVQDFEQLRAACLGSGQLFEDPEFPADNSSLYFSRQPGFTCKWRRPQELVKNPQFFVEGPSRFDIKQGNLGNCWFLAAAANLTLVKEFFDYVVPLDQSYGKDYAGIFHFRFWQFGRWVEVVVDDRLPSRDGKLVFSCSSQTNEFWSALFEKAYAKLYGSYEALDGGTMCEAMVDFTGGVSEHYDLAGMRPDLLLHVLLTAHHRKSMMGCAIAATSQDMEAVTKDGLVKGHAYSITSVKVVEFRSRRSEGKETLVRLRNPWGKIEWTGPWSDKSTEWRYVSDEEKRECGLVIDDDGEFWMSLEYLQRWFTEVELCSLSFDCLAARMGRRVDERHWSSSEFQGSWVKGLTAGGCGKFQDSFWRNPQYRITVEGSEDGGTSIVIVALMQKNRRAQRKMGLEDLSIGYQIFHLGKAAAAALAEPMGKEFFRTNQPVAMTPHFANVREATCRFKMAAGAYLVVPSTFEPDEEGEFLVRVFSECGSSMEENDVVVGLSAGDQRVKKPELNDAQKEHFRQLAGNDMEVCWEELKEILDILTKSDSNPSGYSKEVCRSLIAIMDVDHSGKLSFEEFNVLWTDVGYWTGVFGLYDKDRSGSLGLADLREALQSAGYSVNYRVLSLLARRYGDKLGRVSFQDYLLCAIRLKNMIDVFKLHTSESSPNIASFTMNEWLERTLYM